MTLSSLLLWIRTVRYLRPVQIYWRLWRMLRRPKPRRIEGLEPCKTACTWHAPDRASAITSKEVATFLNRTESISSPRIWNDPRLPKLWLYNLHYFADLCATGAESRADLLNALIRRWIAENPPGTGEGWEPYPTSLRITNWVKWVHAGNSLPEGALDSLAMQADHLAQDLEYHLLGNHLFANAKALLFAASLFNGSEATKWRETALRILARELPEQSLPDGGQFELSTMYHALFAEDLLDLVQLAQIDPAIPSAKAASWRRAAESALGWMDGMTHPDGEIAFFNDAAFEIAVTPAALHSYARTLDVPARENPPQQLDGYVRLERGPAVLICDIAPIGPDYLPGHAHADTLTFELSLAGHRLIANGGTSVYGEDLARRQAERATRAHNTVEVDGRDSSEVWSAFRVARRARVSTHPLKTAAGALELRASHDGFTRFGGPVHTRTWQLEPGQLVITDQLTGTWKNAAGRLRILPAWSVTPEQLTGPLDVEISVSGADVRVEEATWSPEFGKIIPCKALRFDFRETTVVTTLKWGS